MYKERSGMDSQTDATLRAGDLAYLSDLVCGRHSNGYAVSSLKLTF